MNAHHVASWPFATNCSLAPDCQLLGGEAEVAGRRSKMTDILSSRFIRRSA